MTIPAEVVALFASLAGAAWVMFARSQAGRRQAKVLIWLAFPYFVHAAVYIWFSLSTLDIQIRAIYARYVIVGISLSQAVVLASLAYFMEGKRRGR